MALLLDPPMLSSRLRPPQRGEKRPLRRRSLRRPSRAECREGTPADELADLFPQRSQFALARPARARPAVSMTVRQYL